MTKKLAISYSFLFLFVFVFALSFTLASSAQAEEQCCVKSCPWPGQQVMYYGRMIPFEGFKYQGVLPCEWLNWNCEQ